MSKSVAVLGLGKYGRSLSESLYDLGADVLAVDCDEKIVEDMSDRCSTAVCADLTKEEAVLALGLKDMDVVVCAMGGNLAASVMSVAVAKEQGVPMVVAKASSDRMASVLLKVGADKILDPEGEGGSRSARILLSASFKDFFKLDENMYMIEMIPRKDWIGKNLIELDMRRNFNVNVVAVRKKGELWRFVDPQEPFTAESLLLIVMEKKHMKKFERK